MGILRTHQTYFSILQNERAEQDQKRREGLSTSHELINQLLEVNERQQASANRRWLPRFNIRFSPTVTIKNDQKKVDRKEHHFYPTFVHGHAFPQAIVEDPNSGDVFIAK